MRFSVYGEEWRPDREVEGVCTPVRDEPGTVYWCLRFYLGPDVIHRPGDDDTSALNLFLPRKQDGRPDCVVMRTLLRNAITKTYEIESAAADGT